MEQSLPDLRRSELVKVSKQIKIERPVQTGHFLLKDDAM